ncbi:MAG: hypothetical protein JXA78_12170 [Anaerolineales bacterium]|nr:hypothetical protein [Anaerolineales bacterium]
MDDKITIIEGPPPVFEEINDGWALGLSDGPYLYNIVLTRLRTFNGPGLVERCRRAWNKGTAIHLEFRGMDGLESQVPIVAARALEVDDGQMLFLWVRQELEEVELEMDYDDDFGEDFDDPGFPDP